MHLRDYDDDDGKKVWLSSSEVEQLLATVDDVEKRIAFGLGVRCGLRCQEAVDVAPQDVVEAEAGTVVQVLEGKGGKYRQTPIPETLASRILTVGEVREAPVDDPVVTVTTRQVRRWVEDAREQLRKETGTEGWRYLTFHDLRGTWATLLRDADVDAEMVMEWGGWGDLETFLDHYKGRFSPEAQRRARESVDWL